MANHPFHLVTPSPWPMILSMNIMNFLISIILLFYNKNNMFLFINLIPMILSMYQWWRDIVRESTFQGFHSFKILKLLKISMTLFIVSELFFFISFFWTYLHAAISPNIEISNLWPPMNISPFNPYDIPLLNSIILISSGISVTWCHYSILSKQFNQSKISLFLTIILGIYFSILQIFEYNEASFCYNDSIYGSIFFLTTGFHGSHVNIGIIFLSICFIRLIKNHFSTIHHFNFEAASWYWHFVDIIWLFVYMLIYWWMY